MKNVLKVVVILAVMAGFSTNSYARAGNGSAAFWGFMEKFFTGYGLDTDCTVLNSQDALKEAALVQTMSGHSSGMTFEDNKTTITTK